MNKLHCSKQQSFCSQEVVNHFRPYFQIHCRWLFCIVTKNMTIEYDGPFIGVFLILLVISKNIAFAAIICWKMFQGGQHNTKQFYIFGE